MTRQASSAAPPAPSPAAPPRLLDRSFVLLWQGQLVSQLGDQAFLVAIGFWTAEATGSASLLGLLMMLSALPPVVLGPVAGALADRRSRLGIVIGCDVLRGIALVGLAAVVAGAGSVETAVAALAVAATFNGVVGAFFRPAVAALVPDLVPRSRVAAANSLIQLSAQGAVLLGQAVGGIAYRLLGLPVLLAVDGVSYLLSAVSEGFIRRPRAAAPRHQPLALAATLRSYGRDTLDGLGFVWRRAGMRGFLVAAGVFNFFAMPVFVLLPFYVTQQIGRGAAWYGFLLAAMGAGTLAGYLWGGTSKAAGPRRAALVLALFGVAGAAVAFLGLVRDPAAALALFALLGVASGAINVYVLTLFQLAPPPEMRGRVLALVLTLAGAATPAGMALGGVAGDLVGQVGTVYLGCGAALVATAAVAAARPPVRRFVARAGEEAEAAG